MTKKANSDVISIPKKHVGGVIERGDWVLLKRLMLDMGIQWNDVITEMVKDYLVKHGKGEKPNYPIRESKE
jgi:hypothetical protein